MRIKIISLFFMMYLLITSSAVFLQQNNLYSLSTRPEPTGRKVCLILIDGLRFDAIKSMSFVSKLTDSNSAVLYKSYSGLPSYSRPGYERILTGTDSTTNGINSNKKNYPSLIPDIFALSKKSGLNTSAAAFYWIKQLYPFTIDKGYYYFIRDGITFKKSQEFVMNNLPDFMLVHPMTVDNAGHKFGGNSREYSQTAKNIDKEIESLWHTLAGKGYTIILTSDHGHRDEGGHGDSSRESTEVPLILWDSNMVSLGLKAGNNKVTQLDIAPTICDIMGLPKTIYMYGDSLVNHSDEIQKIRSFYSGPFVKHFPEFFRVSWIITYFIICTFTIIYLSCGFIVIRIMKN